MIKKLFLTLLGSVLFSSITTAQNTDNESIATTEGNAIKTDTIKKVVEIIKYEYYEPEPVHLQIGTGIIFGNTSFNSEVHNKTSYQIGVPLVIKLTKGYFVLESGVNYQGFSFKKDYSDTVEVQEPYTVIETVVVDTIYKDNNGTLEQYIVTKEVEKTEYKTAYNPRTYKKKYIYSTYTIPLIIGGQLNWNKFSATIGAGASLNIFTPKAQKQLKEDFPKEKEYFFSGQVNLGVDYHLTKNISLSFLISTARNINTNIYKYHTYNTSFRVFYKLY